MVVRVRVYLVILFSFVSFVSGEDEGGNLPLEVLEDLKTMIAASDRVRAVIPQTVMIDKKPPVKVSLRRHYSHAPNPIVLELSRPALKMSRSHSQNVEKRIPLLLKVPIQAHAGSFEKKTPAPTPNYIKLPANQLLSTSLHSSADSVNGKQIPQQIKLILRESPDKSPPLSLAQTSPPFHSPQQLPLRQLPIKIHELTSNHNGGPNRFSSATTLGKHKVISFLPGSSQDSQLSTGSGMGTIHVTSNDKNEWIRNNFNQGGSQYGTNVKFAQLENSRPNNLNDNNFNTLHTPVQMEYRLHYDPASKEYSFVYVPQEKNAQKSQQKNNNHQQDAETSIPQITNPQKQHQHPHQNQHNHQNLPQKHHHSNLKQTASYQQPQQIHLNQPHPQHQRHPLRHTQHPQKIHNQVQQSHPTPIPTRFKLIETEQGYSYQKIEPNQNPGPKFDNTNVPYALPIKENRQNAYSGTFSTVQSSNYGSSSNNFVLSNVHQSAGSQVVQTPAPSVTYQKFDFTDVVRSPTEMNSPLVVQLANYNPPQQGYGHQHYEDDNIRGQERRYFNNPQESTVEVNQYVSNSGGSTDHPPKNLSYQPQAHQHHQMNYNNLQEERSTEFTHSQMSQQQPVFEDQERDDNVRARAAVNTNRRSSTTVTIPSTTTTSTTTTTETPSTTTQAPSVNKSRRNRRRPHSRRRNQDANSDESQNN